VLKAVPHTMAFPEFNALLQQLPHRSDVGQASFAADVLPSFSRTLGYDPAQLFFEPAAQLQGGWLFDAAIAASRASRPRIVIETKAYVTRALEEQWRMQLLEQTTAYSSRRC
jgi:hypothetical protein